MCKNEWFKCASSETTEVAILIVIKVISGDIFMCLYYDLSYF